MTQRALVAFVLGSTSCGGENVVRVDWPELGSARSVLVVTETTSEVIGRGARAEDLPPISQAFDRLTLFLYDESLEGARLPDGLIDPTLGKRRADESHFERILVFDADELTWKESVAGDLSERTRGFLLPGGLSCFIDHESIALPRGSGVRTILSLGGDRIFVQTMTDGLVISSDRSTRTVATPTVTTGSHRSADGTLLFGGRAGEVFWGEVEDALTLSLIAKSPRGEPIRFLIGDRSVFHVLTSSGSVERWDGEWHLLHSFDPPLGGASAKGGLVEDADGTVLAAFATSPEIIRFGDRLEREHVTDDFGTGITAMGSVDGLGVVASVGVSGRFFVRETEGWRELERADFGLDVLAIASAPNGFVFGGNFGSFGRWSRDGQCPIQQITGHSARFIGRLGDRFAISGEPPSRGQASEVVLVSLDQ
ncbi:MAG: hypothetical protein HY791_39805 [Deltaproteobacteria bacterium]|nr:hypothetical protein [Deltaproteobacteria bacterium]